MLMANERSGGPMPEAGDIAEVGDDVDVGESLGHAGGGEGVRVVPCAVHGLGADGDQAPVEGGGDLGVDAGVAGLAGEQVGDGVLRRWPGAAGPSGATRWTG
jgi:hypothetical protein